MNIDQTEDCSLKINRARSESQTQLLLLPDGRVLAHNLTPAMAEVLQQLDPENLLIQQRCQPVSVKQPSQSAPPPKARRP